MCDLLYFSLPKLYLAILCVQNIVILTQKFSFLVSGQEEDLHEFNSSIDLSQLIVIHEEGGRENKNGVKDLNETNYFGLSLALLPGQSQDSETTGW